MRNNNRQKWQASSMVVEEEVRGNCYSEIDSDSENSNNEVGGEDPALDREVADLQGTSNDTTPSILSVHEPKRTPKLTTDTLECDNF